MIGEKSGLDISKYDMNEMVMGMLVELEHGSQNEKTNITNDEPIETLKIVMVHLSEIPDYYTRLKKMEDEAESVKTDGQEDSEDELEVIDKNKKITMENIAKRYKELSGIIENEKKRQLKNIKNQEKGLLKEEVDPEKFEISKFDNDGLGKKTSDEDLDLYKMQSKNKKN